MELRLELTADAQTVRGSVRDQDGHQRSFWGWLELMEALQQLGGPQDHTDPTPDSVRDPEGRLRT
ncbi:MAG TPA: hypothetical protein VF954_08230 [Acidimicrobiales bacterium]